MLILWVSAQTLTGLVLARVKKGTESGERGEVLVWVVLAVGGAAIAYLVLAQFRDKTETIVNNICTNADPTTC